MKRPTTNAPAILSSHKIINLMQANSKAPLCMKNNSTLNSPLFPPDKKITHTGPGTGTGTETQTVATGLQAGTTVKELTQVSIPATAVATSPTVSTSYIQILGGGAKDGGNGVLLFFDQARYLFNCGEGTQRLATEHHIKIGTKLNAVFLSNLSWKMVGGLPGMVCTIADGALSNTASAGGGESVGSIVAGASSESDAVEELDGTRDPKGVATTSIAVSASASAGRVHLVGPTNTGHFLASLRPFLRRSQMELKLTEVSDDQDHIIYEDSLITVYGHEFTLPIATARRQISDGVADSNTGPNPTCQPNIGAGVHSVKDILFQMFKTDSLSQEEEASDGTIRCKGSHHGLYGGRIDGRLTAANLSKKDSRIIYCIHGPLQPGRFNAGKAKSLGVPFGPLNGRLMRGERVILDNGVIIHPEDVTVPSQPGFIFYIIDLTTPPRPAGIAIDANADADDTASAKDDATPCTTEFLRRKTTEVLNREKNIDRVKAVVFYQNSEDRFDLGAEMGAAWKNVVFKRISHSNHDLIYPSALEVIKPLYERIDSSIFCQPTYAATSTAAVEGGVFAPEAKPLEKIFWYLDQSQKKIKTQASADNMDNKGRSTDYSFGSDAAGSPRGSLRNTAKPNDPIITFLGTAAALPGKYRNVSGILVDFGDSAFLLDCGEASLGQIYRRFGPEESLRILKRLDAIIISHHHADHQLGTIGVLSHCHELGLPSLPTIVAPHRYKQFMEEYAECSLLPPFNFVSNQEIQHDHSSAANLLGGVVIGSCLVRTVPVIHCIAAFGIILKYQKAPAGCESQGEEGIQITYSGDTRPCLELARAGKNSHILIHEATFCDSLHHEACDKRHSTIGEAIGIGQQMESRYTLLTHISQRYAKTLPPHDWTHTDCRNALPALDLMSISPSQLDRYYPLNETLIPYMIDLLPKEEGE